MDRRLLPLNGLLALMRQDGAWPSPLAEQGFARSLLEAPVITPLGNIRADALIYRVNPSLVLLCECKSGKNIADDQAKRYASADAASLERTGVTPADLKRASFVVSPLFVGLESERAFLERGVGKLSVAAPLLTVGPDRVRLSGASGVPGLDDFDIAHKGGHPPARIRVDHQSPDDEIAELLVQQIVAAQARREEFISTEALARAILPEWALLSHSAQRDFIRRAESVLRSVAGGELNKDIRFEPGTSGVQSRLRILRTPADFAPRGVTQGWQGMETRAAKALRRPRSAQIPGQLSIEDLAEEGGI